MTEQQELLSQSEAVEAAYRARSADDFLLFVRGLTIPGGLGPRLFDEVMAKYQLNFFKVLANSLHAVRDGVMPPIRRFWVERTKKAGKDSDLATCLMWLLAFPKRPMYLQVGAADRDQAAIIRRRMVDLVHYNPWLEEFIDVQRYRVVNRYGNAELDILAADIAGSHGETPDVLVVNELSHVTKFEFIENLLDNADGVPRGLTIVATNAGFKGTRAELMRRNAENSGRWSVHLWRQPAPWISPEDVEDARKRSTHSRFMRLWYGQWASGKGDALSEEYIDRCFADNRRELRGPEPGWTYIGGLDLGVSHDHSGLVVLGVNINERRLRLAWMRAWEPNTRTGKVDLITVEEACYVAYRTFHLSWLGYDPTEARLMAQQLIRRGVPMVEVTFSSGRNLTAMAEAMIQVIEGGLLECYDDEEGRLRRDFGKFNIVERSYGYKLEAVSDEYGHADVGTALAICLPRAVGMLAGRVSFTEDDVIAEFDSQPLSKDEVEEMPSELRDIYGLYDDLEADYRRR